MKTRDLTKKQFRAALNRHGFTLGPFGYCTHEDNPATSYGAIVNAKTFKVMRRATLAHVCQSHEAAMKKKKVGEGA